MKDEKTPIELNGTKYLLFDLNAFYEFDRVYGSINKVFRAINDDESIIPYILHIGLAHEEVVPVEHLELLVDLSNRETLKKKILRALNLALPEPDENKKAVPVDVDDVNKPLEWNMFYYIGTVVFGMPESVFWSCTLRKLFSLNDAHVKYNTPNKADDTQATASDDFINQYM